LGLHHGGRNPISTATTLPPKSPDPFDLPGQAEIAVSGDRYIGIAITPHSGHFLNGASAADSARALEIAKEAFRKAGVAFE